MRSPDGTHAVMDRFGQVHTVHHVDLAPADLDPFDEWEDVVGE